MDENCILVDWFSASTRVYDPVGLIDFLGLDSKSFMHIHGFYGYADRLYFGGISIHYNLMANDPDKTSVLLEMSGKGCRQFETSSSITFMQLFEEVKIGNFNITRLDIAYDDIDKECGKGLLDIHKIVKYTLHQRFVSKWGGGELLDGFKINGNNEPMTHALTVQFGSNQSDIKLRIYDKAQERGGLGYHWIRAEIVFRRDRALEFINQCLSGKSIGSLYAGCLRNYLRFIRLDHSRRERCSIIGWWDNFLNHAEAVKLFTKKDIDYNLDRVCSYVLGQAGNNIMVFLMCYGVEELLNDIVNRKSELNLNQRMLVDNFCKDHPELKDDVKNVIEMLSDRRHSKDNE